MNISNLNLSDHETISRYPGHKMDDANSLVRELAFGISNSFGLIGDTVIRAMARVAAEFKLKCRPRAGIRLVTGHGYTVSISLSGRSRLSLLRGKFGLHLRMRPEIDMIKSQAGLRQWAIQQRHQSDAEPVAKKKMQGGLVTLLSTLDQCTRCKFSPGTPQIPGIPRTLEERTFIFVVLYAAAY